MTKSPSSFETILGHRELYSLRADDAQGSASEVFCRAQTLVYESHDLPPIERRESLLEAFGLLLSLRENNSAWEPDLVKKRIFQTEIAILDLQGNFADTLIPAEEEAKE